MLHYTRYVFISVTVLWAILTIFRSQKCLGINSNLCRSAGFINQPTEWTFVSSLFLSFADQTLVTQIELVVFINLGFQFKKSEPKLNLINYNLFASKN